MKTKKETSAGGILFKVIQGKYYIAVIHRSKQNDWTLPKGHVKLSESLEATAIREVEEETNNKATIVDEVGSFSYFADDKEKAIRYERIVYWFLMESHEDNSDKLDSETDQVKWIDIDDDFSFMTYANDKSMVSKGITLIHSLKSALPN